MKEQGRILEKILIEGKVFKGGATWKKLEKFFEKPRETILEDLSTVATPEEINFIVDQIDANEHYQENVRIIDPACLDDKANIPALFSLNSKLCSVTSAEGGAAAQELKDLNYLMIFSRSINDYAATKYDNDNALDEKEQEMFAAYDYFNSRSKKVLLMTPDENTLKRAAERGINAVAFTTYFQTHK